MWSELLGSTLSSKDGPKDTAKCLSCAECVMIYISAHWCGPCRAMTPKLADAYKKQTGNSEVVFLSLDNTNEAFEEYFKTMPWYAVQYDDESCDRHAIINSLSTLCGTPIKSIPCLLVFDKDCCIVSCNGCDDFDEYFKTTVNPSQPAADAAATSDTAADESPEVYRPLFSP